MISASKSRSQINLLVGRGIEFRFRICVNHNLVKDRVKVTDWISFSLTGMFFSPLRINMLIIPVFFFSVGIYISLLIQYLWLFLSKRRVDWQPWVMARCFIVSVSMIIHQSDRSQSQRFLLMILSAGALHVSMVVQDDRSLASLPVIYSLMTLSISIVEHTKLW